MMPIKSSLSILVAGGLLVCCRPAVRLPPVHEPLASADWKRCAGELAERESVAMIDDLTLDSKTLLCRGVVLASEGKIEEGLELLTESSIRDKADHRPLYLSGRILTGAGRYEEALTAFERSAKRFPSLAVPSERLGRQISAEKGAQEAIRFLEGAAKRNLCIYGCQGLLAELYHENGQDEEAETLYRKMVTSEPAKPEAYVGLAGLSNRRSKYREEAYFLEKAVHSAEFQNFKPEDQAETIYSLAFAYYNSEEYDKAAGEIRQALGRVEDKPEWQVLAGWIELKRSRPEKAIELFEKARNLDKRLGAAYAGLGDARIELKNYKEAGQAYQQARDIDPTNTVYILKLAYARALQGEMDRAAKLVDEAARLDKDHLPPDLLIKVTELLGGP